MIIVWHIFDPYYCLTWYLVNEICGLVTVVGLRLTLARLCGLAFTSGLVSKECVVNVASITSLSILMEFGVIIRTVLTIIYRARILVAMNSMYSTLLVLRIAGLSSSGLVMRRLLFRTMTINNVVLNPSTILIAIRWEYCLMNIVWMIV